MAGFFGTEQQQALQKLACAMRDRIAGTPGFYNAGRFVGVDDPDRVRPEEMERMLARDRLLGLRMIPAAQAARLFPALEARGCRIDRWDILVGDAEGAGSRARAIAEAPLPHGLRIMPQLAGPQDGDTVGLQQFLAANGLAPFPGTMLADQPPHAKTIVLAAGDRIAAAGHAYFPHNGHSRWHRHAWVGLIAVDEAARGRGLGRLVNALLVRAAFEELGARHVYEMVAPSNVASRRMIEACGLRLDPAVSCGVAVPVEAARFTR